MKLLSIAIPCYNSQDYMEHCIESLLVGGEDVEILIVDDGSKDRTAEIADRYAENYPDIVKAIHQEVDEESYRKVLDTLRELSGGSRVLDMLISNFVYEKEGAKHKKVMKYTGTLPENQIFGWNEAKHFRKGQYILMHSVIYRTQLLRECGLELPKHTFYVDNIFVYVPLPHVKNMYYLNVDFYRYFIGRDDQSVNEKVMIGRIDQQIRVNKLMVESVDLWKLTNRKLRKYMFNYLEIITVVSTIMLIRSGTQENLEKKRELWKYLKNYDLRLFWHLRKGIMGQTMNLPGKGGRRISVAAYKISQKVVGFN